MNHGDHPPLVCLRCRPQRMASGQSARVVDSKGQCAECGQPPGLADGPRPAFVMGAHTPALGTTDPLNGLAPKGEPSELAALFDALSQAAPGGAMTQEAWLMGTYARTHFPVAEDWRLMGHAGAVHLLSDWLVATLQAHQAEGPLIEWGANVGGLARAWRACGAGPVTLADLKDSAARVAAMVQYSGRAWVPWRACGQRFEAFEAIDLEAPLNPARVVVADALNPPFEAASFGVVAALSVLDIVPQPWVFLGQMDAILAPGGLLVLGVPYHYDPSVQAPGGWLDGPEALERVLGGAVPGLALDYEIVARGDDLIWPLAAHDRLAHLYRVATVVARKRV